MVELGADIYVGSGLSKGHGIGGSGVYSVGGRTFYVSTTAGSGNDGLSLANAFRLVDLASADLREGDTIRFESGGTFTNTATSITFKPGCFYEVYGGSANAIFDMDDTGDNLFVLGQNFSRGGYVKKLTFQNGLQTGLNLNPFSALTGGSKSVGWRIMDCVFANNGQHGAGMLGGGHNSTYTFTGCTFNNNGVKGLDTFAPGVSNTTVSNCTFHNNTGTGCTINAVDGRTAKSNNLIVNCVSYNNGQDGIGIGRSSIGDIVENCLSYDNGRLVYDRSNFKLFGYQCIARRCSGYGASRSSLSGGLGHGIQIDSDDEEENYPNSGKGNRIESCVFWDNLYGAGISVCYEDNVVEHCTVAQNKFGINSYIPTDTTNLTTNLVVRNIAMFQNSDSQINFPSDSLAGSPVISLDTLSIVKGTGTNYVEINGSSYANAAAVNAVSGWSGIIESAQGFTDSANDDYSLASGSNLLGAGSVNASTDIDFIGGSFSGNRSIGAYATT